MVEESQDPANKCHHMVASLHMDSTVQEYQEVLLEHTEAIQDHSMVDLEPLLVIILVIQVLEDHNLTVQGHKETVRGLLIPVGLHLILREV